MAGSSLRGVEKCGWGRCFVAHSTMNIELQVRGLEDSIPAAPPHAASHFTRIARPMWPLGST